MTLLRPSRPLLLLVAAALSLATLACSDSPTTPSPYAPFSRTDLRVGSGAVALAGTTLTVHYTGWIYDGGQPEQKGPQFETSTFGTPFSFTLGLGQVISGWDEGLVGMQAGGLRRLVLPPSKAYGNARNGIIPPNSTLIFEVELLEVQ